ncbi:MAG: hypothetical protein HGA71_08015 [Azonexaceae bacterium]|jgi:hypothetical protein|nr:hypothetical protein [Azonexaceae bacterium]
MDEKKMPEHETIRLLFELDRADDPQLYDDLIRFKKGTKRINRLRLLAREGVIGQLSLTGVGMVSRQLQVAGGNSPAAELPAVPAIAMPLASEVFGEPIADH